MAVSAAPLRFTEQNAFFRRKMNMPTNAWTDVYGPEHDYAFVVAGANRDDLVQDFREAVDKAIAQGATLESFRKDFDRIITTHGWSYNGGRNWRSRVIYDTNLNSAYQAGRYEQLMAVREERPYWQYLHSDAVEHPRPLHESWNGLILRWDDPWWKTHFPVNAWGCQCRVIALSEDDLRRMGRSGPDTAPPIVMETRTIGQRSPGGPRTVEVPAGIDPGFEHVPGQSRLDSAVPAPRPSEASIPAPVPGLPNRPASDPLPDPRPVPAARILPSGLSDAEYARRCLEAFGATLDAPAIVRDAIGERLVVGREMFTDRATGDLNANRDGNGKWLPLLADTIKAPDEIWVRLEWLEQLNQAVVRRRYIARYFVEGEPQPALVIFEVGADGWASVISFAPGDPPDGIRQGIRLYQREE